MVYGVNNKLFSYEDTVVSDNNILNPFSHHPKLTTCDKIRIGFFTVLVLPVRILTIAALLVVAWCLACVGLYGMTEDDLMRRPIRGWRCVIREWICTLGQYAYFAGGMHIVVKGKQATRTQAPILVIAPHSTFLDAAVVYVTGFPSIIVRRESGKNPWLGKLINFTQPVYVGREDRDSRQKTIQNIIDRTTSNDDWPQVLIFPEGTCTNRSCLITFKPGAFYPGVPVQPVLLRYTNKLDTVTWTWDGPGALTLLWLTLTRARSNCEIEFLPVYTPNEKEKQDTKLFANNVRALMANALGIPTSEYSYEDIYLLQKAKDLDLAQSSQLIRTYKLRSRLGLNYRDKMEENKSPGENLKVFTNNIEPTFISKTAFANLLAVDEDDSKFEELYQMYCEKRNEVMAVNLEKYQLAVYLTNKATNKKNMIRLAFECYDTKLSKEKFRYVMLMVYAMSRRPSDYIFDEIATKGKTAITYDEYISYFRMYPDKLCENNNSDRYMKQINKKHT